MTFIVLALGSVAQKPESISITIMNESISMPLSSFDEFHHGLEIGTTLWSKENEKTIQQFNTYGGWYFHQNIENAFYLRGEYQFSRKVIKGFYLDMYGGAGYLHTFYPGKMFEMNTEDGSFTEVKQTGHPRALISLGLGLSYRNDSGIEPFVKQELAIETPFANGIPFMPHAFTKIGINFKF